MASPEFPNGGFAPFTAEHPPARRPPAAAAAANGSGEKLRPVSGILEVEVHQARNLHNICIYAKQDVYAKLSLDGGAATATAAAAAAAAAGQPTAFYTEVVDKGGKDPVFNQKFRTAIVQSDRALKCEVWMASKMRDYLQDQLLGAATLPLSALVGKGKEFFEFELSSTELFHSPAGSLSMTLKFVQDAGKNIQDAGEIITDDGSAISDCCEITACNSTTSNLSASSVDGIDIDSKAVGFADLADAREDEELVSDFIHRKQNVEAAAKDDGIFTGPPFLKLDRSAVEKKSLGQIDSPTDEHSAVEEDGAESEKLFSAPADKPDLGLVLPASPSVLESTVSNGVTPSSKPAPGIDLPADLETEEKIKNNDEGYGFVSKPVIQPEPRILQQEIMDLYTKSMQQFSDALAKMQLPVDENGLIKLDEASSSETTNSKDGKNNDGIKSNKIDNSNNNSSSGSESSDGGKRNPASNTPRVFYGSRAFF